MYSTPEMLLQKIQIQILCEQQIEALLGSNSRVDAINTKIMTTCDLLIQDLVRIKKLLTLLPFGHLLKAPPLLDSLQILKGQTIEE